MPITCHDILLLKSFSKISLLAGSQGLHRTISWPYSAQTADISPWVHGDELVFITGFIHDNTMLQALFDECIQKQVAGLIILLSDEYITHIPESLLEQANRLDFPLFSMPYELKLLEVTKEISDLIIRDKLKCEQEKDTLNTWLFSEQPDFLASLPSNLPSQISIDDFCFAAALCISENFAEETAKVEELQRHLHSLFISASLKVYFTTHERHIICMVFINTKDKTQAAMSCVEQVTNTLRQTYANSHLTLGLGQLQPIRDMRTSYAEAKMAVDVALRITDMETARYQHLGIYYLLNQSNNLDEMSSYYNEYLEPVLTYDTQNNATLLVTLHAYLQCNGNVAKTAQKIFVHRNTLLYRLNQIRELTGMDLDDAMTRMHYLTAILVREYASNNPKI